jgi:ketosteroid isomerase-like protein
MSTSDNKEALQSVFDAMALGNTRPFGELMADDCVWCSPGQSVWSGIWRGKQAMNEQLFVPLYKRFEGKYTNHALRFIADGNVVVVEARGRAALKGGGDYNNTYCFVCEFRADGKLKQVTEYMDTDLAVRVLGAPATPATS